MKKETKKNLLIVAIVVFTLFLGLVFANIIIHFVSEQKFKSALSDLKHIIRDTYSGRNSIEVKGHTVTIKIWSEDMSVTVKKAGAGDSYFVNLWNELRDKMYNFADSVCDMFNLVTDAKIYLCYVNEKNTDLNLLVFKNRDLYYDVVTGYKAGG